MKHPILPTFCLLACAACNTHTLQSNTTPMHQPVTISQNHLVGTWRLHTWTQNGTLQAPIKGADGEHLTIQFTQTDERIAVLNGCNFMSAPYRIEQEQLKIGPFLSTRKMCEPELMQVDALAGKLLQENNRFKLERSGGGTVGHVQWIIDMDNAQYRFIQIKS